MVAVSLKKFFFFKQKTAYEISTRDWSSDVCSSDLEAQLKAFFDAGYTQENAIDVILGVSLATLCNYVNNIAETPINPELQAFA